jgi:hypothetical protein
MSSDGSCVSSKCGYLAQALCIADTACQWLSGQCTTAKCIGLNESAACAATAGCQWTDLASPPCSMTSCPYTNAPMCTSDTKCLWSNGTCVRNTCPTLTKTQCDAKPSLCRWQDMLSVCQNNVCSFPTEASCLSETTTDPQYTKDPTQAVGLCTWPSDDVGCVPKDVNFMASLAAAVSSPPTKCSTVTPDRTIILIALLVIAGLLLIATVWMIRAQYANRPDNSMDLDDRLYDEDDGDELSDIDEPNDTIQDAATTRGRPNLDDI